MPEPAGWVVKDPHGCTYNTCTGSFEANVPLCDAMIWEWQGVLDVQSDCEGSTIGTRLLHDPSAGPVVQFTFQELNQLLYIAGRYLPISDDMSLTKESSVIVNKMLDASSAYCASLTGQGETAGT